MTRGYEAAPIAARSRLSAVASTPTSAGGSTGSGDPSTAAVSSSLKAGTASASPASSATPASSASAASSAAVGLVGRGGFLLGDHGGFVLGDHGGFVLGGDLGRGFVGGSALSSHGALDPTDPRPLRRAVRPVRARTLRHRRDAANRPQRPVRRPQSARRRRARQMRKQAPGPLLWAYHRICLFVAARSRRRRSGLERPRRRRSRVLARGWRRRPDRPRHRASSRVKRARSIQHRQQVPVCRDRTGTFDRDLRRPRLNFDLTTGGPVASLSLVRSTWARIACKRSEARNSRWHVRSASTSAPRTPASAFWKEASPPSSPTRRDPGRPRPSSPSRATARCSSVRSPSVRR